MFHKLARCIVRQACCSAATTMTPRVRAPVSRTLLRRFATVIELPETKRARLFYQSKKRGILENDLLLGGFAESHLHLLSTEELDAYEHIIDGGHNEWDIYYWLTGKSEPPDTVDKAMISKLREYTVKRGKVFMYHKTILEKHQ